MYCPTSMPLMDPVTFGAMEDPGTIYNGVYHNISYAMNGIFDGKRKLVVDFHFYADFTFFSRSHQDFPSR